MAKVSLTVKTGNEACQTLYDVGTIFMEAGKKMINECEGEPIRSDREFNVRDINGNVVGTVKVRRK
jgi:hypothetical protein